SLWIRVTGGDQDGPAGFYTANMGPVPFAFGKPLPQNYFVLKSFLRVQFEPPPGSRLEPRPGEVPESSKGSWITDGPPAYSLTPESKQQIQAARDLALQGRTQEAIESYRELLGKDLNNPAALIDVAWILATTEKPELRNGPRAVQLALR